jgi:hypothetical protein
MSDIADKIYAATGLTLGAEAAEKIGQMIQAENARLREAALDALASLVAAHSLLKRGGKKAAPSDKMFEQMLCDYDATITRARAALGEKE